MDTRRHNLVYCCHYTTRRERNADVPADVLPTIFSANTAAATALCRTRARSELVVVPIFFSLSWVPHSFLPYLDCFSRILCDTDFGLAIEVNRLATLFATDFSSTVSWRSSLLVSFWFLSDSRTRFWQKSVIDWQSFENRNKKASAQLRITRFKFITQGVRHARARPIKGAILFILKIWTNHFCHGLEIFKWNLEDPRNFI